MKNIKLLFITISLLFCAIANATAILNTDFATVFAEVGSVYPSAPNIIIETKSWDVLKTDFSSGNYSSSNDQVYPNYGWVSWTTTETFLTFMSGQDWRYINSDSYPGYGFSQLELFWIFSVTGSGGQLRQDLLSGTGTIQSTLIDLTDPSTFISLSVPSGFHHDGRNIDLQDDHTYLVHASLANQATGDGFEAEYFIALENAKIDVPEPNSLLLMISGLLVLVLPSGITGTVYLIRAFGPGLHYLRSLPVWSSRNAIN